MTEEPKEPVQPEQTQEPTQSPEDAMLRLAGVPKTPEELEAEREANEKERLERGRVPGPLGGPPGQTGDHPHGGPPGQTGDHPDHPHGGPPGQTGEHPEGGPPPQVNQGPAEPPEAEPKAP
jgi:hypothetical protein